MEYVNLNVTDVKNNIDLLKKEVENYEESINSLGSSFKNVDSTWKDANTPTYISKVEKDFNVFSLQISSINKYIEDTEGFFQSLENISKKYVSIGSLSRFYYSKRIVSSCFDRLNNIIASISKSKSTFKTMSVPFTTGYSSTIHTLFDDVSNSEVVSLNEKISSFSNDLDNIVNSSRLSISHEDFVDIDDSKCEMLYKNVHINGLERNDSARAVSSMDERESSAAAAYTKNKAQEIERELNSLFNGMDDINLRKEKDNSSSNFYNGDVSKEKVEVDEVTDMSSSDYDLNVNNSDVELENIEDRSDDSIDYSNSQNDYILEKNIENGVNDFDDSSIEVNNQGNNKIAKDDFALDSNDLSELNFASSGEVGSSEVNSNNTFDFDHVNSDNQEIESMDVNYSSEKLENVQISNEMDVELSSMEENEISSFNDNVLTRENVDVKNSEVKSELQNLEFGIQEQATELGDVDTSKITDIDLNMSENNVILEKIDN